MPDNTEDLMSWKKNKTCKSLVCTTDLQGNIFSFAGFSVVPCKIYTLFWTINLALHACCMPQYAF
jgi:hypothetical protein